MDQTTSTVSHSARHLSGRAAARGLAQSGQGVQAIVDYILSKEVALEVVCMMGVKEFVDREAEVAAGPGTAVEKIRGIVHADLAPMRDLRDVIWVFVRERHHVPDASRRRVGRKRRRQFPQRDPEALSAVLHILLRVIEAWPRQCSGSAGGRLRALSFVQCFGSALDAHVHFHCRVTDGVFAAGKHGQAHFAESAALTSTDIAALQQQVRARVLR